MCAIRYSHCSRDNGWSEQGGYVRAKQTKLEKQFGDSTRLKSVIFRNVSIYVNGYTTPSASELRELVVSHGGRYRTYYTRSTVTHIIASRLPTSKINRLTDQKLVTADWITESIKAKRLLPWQQFQLYPGHLGGSGQQQLRISRISSTSRNFEQQSAGQDHCAMSNNEHPNESSGHDEVEAGQVEVRPAVRARRVKQVRLDNCLSPVKPPTSSSARPKSSVSLSLKQLLRGFNSCNNSSVPCSSLSETGNTTLPNDTHHPVSSAGIQLATFYARSRLHHLSSWANELHDLVRQLRDDPKAHSLLNSGVRWKQFVLASSNPSPSFIFASVPSSRSTCSSRSKQSLRKPQILFHIDMDCFFVSVSLRSRPELRDKPVAITHANGPNRRHGTNSMSEVASCSYAARKAGIRNGMLLGKARQLCPDLVTLPYEFDAYKSVSEVLYRTVAEFTLDIEAVSCDELYADCTDLLRVSEVITTTPTSSNSPDDNVSRMTYHFIDPLLFAQHLRHLVAARTGGCTASVGFGSSKLLARLATKRAKPNGQSCLFRTAGCCSNEDVQWFIPSNTNDHSSTTESVNCELSGQDAEWLGCLPICELPGVGDAMTKRLVSAFGVTTCGDLMLQVTRKQLTNLLGGRTGERVYWLCRGRDPNETLQVDRQCKSVSACMNYGIRLQKSEELEELIRSLVQELVSRMASVRLSHAGSQPSQGVCGRNLTVRVFVRAPNAPIESAKYMGHGICNKSSRMICLSEPSADLAVLYRSTLTVVRKLCPDPRELRGVGLQMHQLSPITPQLGSSMTLRSSSPDRRPSSTPTGKSTNTEISGDPANLFALGKSRNSQLSNSDPISFDNQLRPFVHSTRRRSLRLKRRRLSPSQSINTVSESLYPTCQPDTQDALDVRRSRDHSPVESQQVLIVQTTESCSLPNFVDRSSNISVIAREYDQTINSQSTGLTHSTDRNTSAVDYPRLLQSRQLSQTSVHPRTLFHDRSIEELQQVFANWITSEHLPLLEDVCILASYLVSLIPNDAERVRLCLVSLDRLVNQFTATHACANAWRTAQLRIQATVQYAIRQFYHNTCIKVHFFLK